MTYDHGIIFSSSKIYYLKPQILKKPSNICFTNKITKLLENNDYS